MLLIQQHSFSKCVAQRYYQDYRCLRKRIAHVNLEKRLGRLSDTTDSALRREIESYEILCPARNFGRVLVKRSNVEELEARFRLNLGLEDNSRSENGRP